MVSREKLLVRQYILAVQRPENRHKVRDALHTLAISMPFGSGANTAARPLVTEFGDQESRSPTPPATGIKKI